MTLLGSNTALTDSSDHELTPDVACHEAAAAFLVVWHNNGGFLPQGIQGRRVLTDGTLPGTPLFYSEDSTASHPAVTVTANEWWVVWQQGTPASLSSQQVLSNGTKAGTNTPLFTGTISHTRPALIGGDTNGRLLLAWEHEEEGNKTIHHALLTLEHLQTTSIHYTYDPLYRLTEASYTGDISATFTYGYDAVGNMTVVTETVGITTIISTRYFNAANQLQASFDDKFGTTSFNYDNNGNLIEIIPPGTDPETAERFVYNQRNLITAYERYAPGTGYILTAEYIYDGIGRRLRLIQYTDSVAITTTFTNDILGLPQVLFTDNGSEKTWNLFGLDLINVHDHNGIKTALADGLGSVRIETNGSQLKSITTYEPFGNLIRRVGITGTVYGFTGEQQDNITSLIYLRARYYSPKWRIFLSRDPFPGIPTQPASQHGYSYAHNNPINMVDPTGQIAIPIAAVAIGVLTIAVVALSIYNLYQAITNPIDFTPLIDPIIAAYESCIRPRPVATSQSAPGIPRPVPAQGTRPAPTVEPKPASTPSPPLAPLSPDRTRRPDEKHISLGLNFVGDKLPLFTLTYQLNTLLDPEGIYVYSSGDWNEVGLSTTSTLSDFSLAFDEASERTRHIHFTLEGITSPHPRHRITDANKFIEVFGANGNFDLAEYITAAELYRVKTKPQLCAKTTFYESGVPSQTAWNTICKQR